MRIRIARSGGEKRTGCRGPLSCETLSIECAGDATKLQVDSPREGKDAVVGWDLCDGLVCQLNEKLELLCHTPEKKGILQALWRHHSPTAKSQGRERKTKGSMMGEVEERED